MDKITLTAWEMAQIETALRERVNSRRFQSIATEDAINQTRSLAKRFALCDRVTIETASSQADPSFGGRIQIDPAA